MTGSGSGWVRTGSGRVRTVRLKSDRVTKVKGHKGATKVVEREKSDLALVLPFYADLEDLFRS